MSKTIVIGAGPAGLIAAIEAKTNNNDVTIIEKNEKIGKKLYITGKGRCNITNYSDISEFFQKVNTNSKFMYSSFYSYTNMDILNLLFENGLEYKVERGERVFPKSDKSSDVIKTFDKIIKNAGINLILNEEVKYIEKLNGKFNVYSKNNSYEADFLVVATGGVSYPVTGSTGDGYKFAKNFGHTVTDTSPSLVPMELISNYIKELQGISLKNVEAKILNDKKIVASEFGEMIFSHYGVSGPIILKLSNKIPKNKKNLRISIDLKPKLSDEKLDNRIIRDFEKFHNKDIVNGLSNLLIQKLIPVVLKEASIPFDKKVNQITKEERTLLGCIIKNLTFDFKDLRPIKEAIITKGGVSTKELNPTNIESKIVENLYFAGEVIDVDAMTGGYNLQVAYSTGAAVGREINERSENQA